ncbi:hypothetical protein JAAARDRAFT_194822 [Jaapia argillacea MUCL 33604]|uniref:Uncharacterized protein n=1 Tax=Jaapia argillacea MUCL 33604 TaxID=933084 RepID=A0A067Q034_9AGAM|nr:hypothetical protein JAAARDRAFT_194822 [Jaapia argillacea MUCL 33604]
MATDREEELSDQAPRTDWVLAKRVTWYRIVCILFVVGFAIPKALLGYRNWVIISINVDLVLGFTTAISGSSLVRTESTRKLALVLPD